MGSHSAENLVPESIKPVASLRGIAPEHPVGHDEVVKSGLGVLPEGVDEFLCCSRDRPWSERALHDLAGPLIGAEVQNHLHRGAYVGPWTTDRIAGGHEGGATFDGNWRVPPGVPLVGVTGGDA